MKTHQSVEMLHVGDGPSSVERWVGTAITRVSLGNTSKLVRVPVRHPPCPQGRIHPFGHASRIAIFLNHAIVSPGRVLVPEWPDFVVTQVRGLHPPEILLNKKNSSIKNFIYR